MPGEDDEIRKLQEERKQMGVKLDAASVAFDQVSTGDLCVWSRMRPVQAVANFFCT